MSTTGIDSGNRIVCPRLGSYNYYFDDYGYEYIEREEFIGKTGSGDGWIDPIFSVDPSFNRSYSIESGIPSSVLAPGGVPEPAAWILMIAGFGLAGSGVRQRRMTVSRV